MRAALCALLLTGCFDPQYDNPTCGPAGECPNGMSCESGVCRTATVTDPDADPDAPDARVLVDAPVIIDGPIVDAPPSPCPLWTFAPSNVACTASTGGNLTISGRVGYDTDDGTFSTSLVVPSTLVAQGLNEPSLRVLDVDTLNIAPGGSLEITGSAALVILVHGAATITGELQAPALLTTAGAGAQVVCSSGGQGVSGNGSGGGGGGSYQFAGGGGGDGSNAGGGAGGVGTTAITLSPLHGGCAGGPGGLSNGMQSDPGLAGGAVQISARDSITISGIVDVSGGGGAGGTGSAGGGGGGGGGAGGGILLESPSIDVSGGSLCADGGAGGQGGGNGTGASGGLGHCGGIAVGGSGASASGAPGGNGGWSTVDPTDGMDVGGCLFGCGGGGGGAGGGVIRVRGTTSGGPTIITPDWTSVPL